MNKALSILSVFILFLSLSACTEDNDDNLVRNTSSFKGVWELSKEVLESPIDINNDGIPSDILYESSELFPKSELIFDDSRNGSIYFSANRSYNTREEDGELIFMIASSTSSERVDIPLTYTLTNNSGTINYEDVDATFVWEGNTLSMTIENGFIARDIDTNEITVAQNLTYEFKKQ